MTKQDKTEFAAYLRQLTDVQLRNVYRKELDAHRPSYANLALTEASIRGIEL